MEKAGHPTTETVQAAINNLWRELKREYGTDYALCIHGQGYLLAASNAHEGTVYPASGGGFDGSVYER